MRIDLSITRDDANPGRDCQRQSRDDPEAVTLIFLDPMMRNSFLLEGNQRLLVPLTAFSFAIIPLACLLPGEFNRRGQIQRVLLAIGFAFLFQSLDLGARNLAARYVQAIPLMYLIDLLPLALGFGILLKGGIRFGLRRPWVPAFAAR